MTPEEFWNILHSPPEVKPVFYRLYHDAYGVPLFYSMEDVPGTYIEIDQETYVQSESKVRVRNGKLVKINWKISTKLVPGNSGSPCHPDNVAVIVAKDQPHTQWSKKTYETY